MVLLAIATPRPPRCTPPCHNPQDKSKEDVVAKYGSAAEPLPDEVKLAGSERYVEYDRSGRVIKGVEVKAKSRYDEDVILNNHTCVWGSWWRDGAWGFACCHSTVKNSYCTGKVRRGAGRAAGGCGLWPRIWGIMG